MKEIWLTIFPCLLVIGCATAHPPRTYDARLYTVNNEEIVVHNLRCWEKNYFVSSKEFHPRWRESLRKENLGFNRVASAVKKDGGRTLVNFRDGRQDEFTDFFVDLYNFTGISDYGPFEINTTLVRALVFLDKDGQPVSGAVSRIPPVIFPPTATDKFITFAGDVVSGNVMARQLKIKTPYDTLMIDTADISEIHIDRESDSLRELVFFKNGDIISGWIEPPEIKVRVSPEKVITIKFKELSRVLFSRPVAAEED